MSLMAGDIGSMLRAQQSAQDDRQQANQAVQNMRNRFANMGPGMTQIPTDGSYSGNMYRQPFARQAPMMDMRGIGGLLAGLLGGFGGGFRGGYGGGYPMPSAYMRERGQTQEYRPEDGPRQPSLQERQQAESALTAGANPAARLGGTIGVPTLISTVAPMGTEFLQPPPFQGGFGQPPVPIRAVGETPRPDFTMVDNDMGMSNFRDRPKASPPSAPVSPPTRVTDMFGSSQGLGGFAQPQMGFGGKGGIKGGGMYGRPSYGMQARYSSPFGNLF